MAGLPIYGSLKEYLKYKDDIVIDNGIFKLHHMANFYIVMIGLIFVFGENYFDSSKIECDANADDYAKTFCWLHGSGYVTKSLQNAGVTSCYMKQGDWEAEDDKGNKYGNDSAPHTAYYVWLPFLLAVCLALSKIPRALWKIFDGGKMEDILGFGEVKGGESKKNKVKDITEAAGIVQRFRDQSPDFWKYHLAYGLCEFLNFVMVLVSMSLSNSLLRGMFWGYGTAVLDYIQNPGTSDVRIEDPRCDLFPTEVSCKVAKGGINQAADLSNHLCILSNNLFNQHYFAFLWWWWVMLLVVSAVSLVYRMLRLASGELSKSILVFFAKSTSKKNYLGLRRTGADYFVLGRIKENVTNNVMDEVVKKLIEVEDLKQDNVELNSKLAPQMYPLVNVEMTPKEQNLV